MLNLEEFEAEARTLDCLIPRNVSRHFPALIAELRAAREVVTLVRQLKRQSGLKRQIQAMRELFTALAKYDAVTKET